MDHPLNWDAEDIRRRRDAIREMAEHVPPRVLEDVAALADMLDNLEKANAGEIDFSEVADRARETRRKGHPHDRITWHAAEQVPRGWTINPADITNEHLADVDPVTPQALSILSSMCEQVWVQTTGDPDDHTETDKTAFVYGATEQGQVFVGLVSDSPTEDDEDGRTQVFTTQVGLVMPVSKAKALRDDLNRAIRRAESLGRKYIEKSKEGLVYHLMSAHGYDQSTGAAIADAASEAAMTGIPQVVVLDDVPRTITVDRDGELHMDDEPVEGGADGC